MEEIDRILKTSPENAVKLCFDQDLVFMGAFLAKACGVSLEDFSQRKKATVRTQETFTNPGRIKIKLLCNWCSSEEISRSWSRMRSINSSIDVVQDNPDYYVVINMTREPIDKKRTVLFRMEPKMETNHFWGEWGNPDDKQFLKVFRHEKDHNNVEWHLSWTCQELLTRPIVKKYNVLSAVLSGKYKDIGQCKRIDFIKFLDVNDRYRLS
jgi:hypothetical protein